MATTDKSLITLADIQRYRPIADIDFKRLEPYILETQRTDMKLVLGDALNYDFNKKLEDVVGFPTEYANYQKLLRGDVWTYDGYTKDFQGLVPMLVYYTLARFIPNNPVNITKFGNTFKKNEFSEPLDARTTSLVVTELRSVAFMYQTEVIEYLNLNPTLFPLFQQGRKVIQNTGGIKFIDLD